VGKCASVTDHVKPLCAVDYQLDCQEKIFGYPVMSFAEASTTGVAGKCDSSSAPLDRQH
jgi:hypothetical protein